MAQLASIAKAGYYPTPPGVTNIITNYLGRPVKDAQVAFYGRAIAVPGNRFRIEIGFTII